MFAVTLLLSMTCATPVPPPPPKEPVVPSLVEVVCMDGSIIKVGLMDEFVTLTSKYGEMKVPTDSIKGVEFANRTPPAQAADITDAVSNLGNPDFEKREAATLKLKKIGPRAYPAAMAACKSTDPEVSRRAVDICGHIKAKHANIVLRPLDTIFTDDSKLTGTFKCEHLKVMTVQFGEQNLRLSEIDKIRLPGAATDDAKPAPPTLNVPDYQSKFGQEFFMKVTAKAPENGASPSVWGSGPYTLDSKLECTVIHAGLAKPGDTVVVRIRIVQSPASFDASTNNGISTTQYGTFPNGGYEFLR